VVSAQFQDQFMNVLPGQVFTFGVELRELARVAGLATG
jgi:hypothetical protein